MPNPAPGRPRASGICGPLHAGAHRGGFIKTEQAVNIVDQHVEVFQKVLAEDAPDVEIDAMQILEFIHEHILVGDGVGAGFEQVHLNVRGRLARSGACDHRCALRLQMKLGGQGGVNQRDLHSGIQEKVVGPGMIDGDRHNHLVAVYEDGRVNWRHFPGNWSLRSGRKPWWLRRRGKRAT